MRFRLLAPQSFVTALGVLLVVGLAHGNWGTALLAAAVAAALVAGLGARLLQPIFERLSFLTSSVRGAAESASTPVQRLDGEDELQSAGRVFNELSHRWSERMTDLGREASTLEAVLDGMAEGVWVTDAEGTILRHNRALKVLLGPGKHILGERPLSLVRSTELSSAVDAACRHGEVSQLEVQVEGLIPRTLAMTYFADLDVSTIDELPPGRTPIVTRVFADVRRPDVVDRIRDEIAAGRQVYWVCPLIEESEEAENAAAEDSGREPITLQNVTETHAALAQALPGFEVGLLHGRMKAADKAAVMARFKSGELPVLVATTVIEVGVDVPNASLMVIEHAERFGLAQLHQLRGRVGRGSAASVCVLLYAGQLSHVAKDRLRAMVETTDGFEIARRDLEIRGPGEFMGARQSGDQLLRFADLQEDAPLLAHVRRVAPELLARAPGAASAHVERWLGGKLEWMKA